MASDTRSTQKSKDDENASSRKNFIETAYTSGLRRSTRDTQSQKQITTSPSATRKSGQIENTTPTRTPLKMKPDLVDKHNISSPLRRSDRFKKHPSSSSSETNEYEKGCPSSDVKSNKVRRKTSMKQLTLEGRETNRRGKRDLKPVGGKKKKMDARTFSSFFKQQLRRDTAPDVIEEVERPDKLSTDDTSCCGSSVSKQVGDEEDGDECILERMGEKLRDKCTEEASEGGTDSSLRNSKEEGVGNDGDVEVSCSSSKRSSRKKPYHSSDGDDLNPSKNGQRLKRQRIDNDSPVQELFLCDVSLDNGQHCSPVHKDSVELEANVQGLVEENNGSARQESASIVKIDGHQNICVVCKLGGTLLCCNGKGCERSYHLSCLNPHLDAVPRLWHCLSCVLKKIESGVLSVCGVESIWDAREVVVQDTEYGTGLQKQKQYFVKYKGLAHIHNHWVPERQLILEAPMLVSNFKENNKVLKWREEWKMPHRLLKKKLLCSPKQKEKYQIEHIGDILDCNYEWLVKWCGLDYEHATWELENASFLQSSLAQSLISKYENRLQRAKRATFSSLRDKDKEGPLVNVSKLPAGVLPGFDFNLISSSVNKLREHWHQGQNAVFFNDQERVQKIILFIGSLVSNISQPFLIISNSSALSLWEAEFSRLDSSIDLVVYSGKEDSRKIIRTFEFYEEGGRIMFQVLLSPIEAVVEDFEMLECLRWEAIIVDECQFSAISEHFEQIKMLSTEVRFLLYNGQLKNSIAEHLNMLSLLESPGDLDSTDGVGNDLTSDIDKVKERLLRFAVYDSTTDFSRFVEYWVPVQISNVQLEQYCTTLHSNYTLLRSCSKKDPFGSLQNVLISTRKTCDHPYILEPLLQGLLTKDIPLVEYLSVGIEASGKLQLLDIILSMIRNEGLRVIILFQSIAERNPIGDILEDFVGQRFGPDSYERLDGGFLRSRKKQAALDNFNDKGNGRFVFLLENRACHCSLKFLSVDGIVIFDGDWNPVNDLRALRKVSISWSVEQIKVFRLYTPCTVEEKVLVLATQDETLDGNLQSLSMSTLHMLLMWGASYLFTKLDEFHGRNTSTTSASSKSEPPSIKEVAQEFFNLLCRDHDNTYPNNSLIIKIQHSEGTYKKNVPLLGEIEVDIPDGEEPIVFWTKLLEGRNPRWRYSSGLSQRNRKRVQNFGDLLKEPEVQTDEAGKKRKKVLNNKAGPASLRSGLKEGELPEDKGVSAGISGVPAGSGSQLSTASVSHTLYKNHASTPHFPSNGGPALHEFNGDSMEAIGVPDVQESLLVLLKPQMSSLCEILELTEDVKVMVGKFLEYIIHNHHVNREPPSVLQAFQISLCWISSSMAKNRSDGHKIDRKKSLLLAKKNLNFCCTEEEANNVYFMLRPLKKAFLSCTENLNEPRDSILAAEDSVKEPPDVRMPPSLAFKLENAKVELEERLEKEEFVEDLVLSQQKEATLHKNCAKQLTKLIRKQMEEIQEVRRKLEGERVQLESVHKMESTLTRSIHGNNPVGLDKLKRLDDEFTRKKEEHKRNEEARLKEIVAKQLAERNKMRQRGVLLMENLKSREQAEPSCELTLDESGFRGFENTVSVSGCLIEVQSPNRIVANGIAPRVMSTTAVSEPVGGGVTVETSSISFCPNHDTNTVNSIAPENNVSVVPPAEEQIRDEASSSAQDTLVPISTGMPDIHELTRRNQNVLQEQVPPLHPTDGVGRPTDQINHDAVVIENIDQLQLSPPSDSAVGPNQQNSRSALAVQPPQSGVSVAFFNVELPQQAENPSPSVPSNLAVLRTGENQLSNAGYISFQNAEASSHSGFIEGHPNPIVSSTVQLTMDPSISSTLTGFGTNFPFPSAHPAATQMPVHVDPLTTELERLRKETEKTNKAYEDTLLQLKSDLEKEIERAIAETRWKYEAKLQAEEAAFAQKKEDLDTNHNKVLMNKSLADAFRSKCLERPSGHPASAPSSSSQQTSAPPLQIVHHSSDLFSRPPLIPSISPSPGNHQAVTEMRTPATHLHSFRPPQSYARNLPTASPLAPPLLVPSQPLPTRCSGLHDRPPQLEVAGALSSLHNSTLSAMSLFFHVHNQPGANSSNILTPLPDLSPNFGALDISQFGSEVGSEMVNSAARSGLATDIVCLSDDEE